MKNYLKILRSFFSGLSKILSRMNYSAIKPSFYWKCLIFVFIFGLIFIALLNVYLFLYFNKYYFDINARQNLNETGKRALDKLDKNKIIKISEELKKREINFKTLMKEKPFINKP